MRLEEHTMKSGFDIAGTLEDTLQALDVGDGEVWWRGQADASWSLLPSAARRYASRVDEYGANRRFQQKAGSRTSKVPETADNLGWLCLMQHYGHATRLLDWSESMLVALYFAAVGRASAEVDGALWALSPRGLNQYFLETDRPAHTSHPEIQSIASAAFGENPSKSVRAAAFAPAEFDGRMLAQHTVFTLHGGWPIEPLDASAANGFLKKILVPREAKLALLKQLFRFGVRHSSLFPDLQNLARELTALDFS